MDDILLNLSLDDAALAVANLVSREAEISKAVLCIDLGPEPLQETTDKMTLALMVNISGKAAIHIGRLEFSEFQQANVACTRISNIVESRAFLTMISPWWLRIRTELAGHFLEQEELFPDVLDETHRKYLMLRAADESRSSMAAAMFDSHYADPEGEVSRLGTTVNRLYPKYKRRVARAKTAN